MNLQPIGVVHWSGSSKRAYRYEYANGKLVKARLDDGPGYEFTYEYGDDHRMIARTVAPNLFDEAGQRTELVYSEGDVVEQRNLTAAGFLRSRVTFTRSANGDVLRAGDGEADSTADLRDECRSYRAVPELVAKFGPYLEVDGMVPFLRPNVE